MWVLAWGSLTFANVLGGVAVAACPAAGLAGRLGSAGGVSFRPIAVPGSLAYVVCQVVKSNVAGRARRCSPGAIERHTGVMAVPLPECSDGMMTIVSNVIALTPGTIPLHLTRHPTVLYVHVLDMRDVAATRRDVQRLADLAFAAFGDRPDAGG